MTMFNPLRRDGKKRSHYDDGVKRCRQLRYMEALVKHDKSDFLEVQETTTNEQTCRSHTHAIVSKK